MTTTYVETNLTKIKTIISELGMMAAPTFPVTTAQDFKSSLGNTENPSQKTKQSIHIPYSWCQRTTTKPALRLEINKLRTNEGPRVCWHEDLNEYQNKEVYINMNM